MKNIQVGNFVVFKQLKQKEPVKIGKKYEIINTDNFKRKGKYVSYITIKDEFKQDYRFRLDENVDVLTKSKHKLEREYEIIGNIETYFHYINEFDLNFLHKNLKDFYNINETSKSPIFKSLVERINSKQRCEGKELEILQNLLEIIEQKAYSVGIKIGSYKFENSTKSYILKENEEDIDNFDYEKDIMNSFRNGEQDRYGY